MRHGHSNRFCLFGLRCWRWLKIETSPPTQWEFKKIVVDRGKKRANFVNWIVRCTTSIAGAFCAISIPLLVNVLAVERGRQYGLSFGIYFKRFGVWHVSRFIFARHTESLPFTIYHPHSTPRSWFARLNVLGSKTCYVNTYDRTSAAISLRRFY